MIPEDPWCLPETAVIGGREWEVNTDFRCALDAIAVMGDRGIDDGERSQAVLSLLFPDYEDMRLSDVQEALDWAFWFVGGGRAQDGRKRPKIMDWEQDFPIIVAPVNRVLGFESRGEEELHWWTFLAAYNEIGDCLYAQVVSIRKKLAAGKKLDKPDKAFYEANREIVDLRKQPTSDEEELFDIWTRR
ncbi:Gp15 family bacteriophage protein [Adlercreutzia muris]|uniref:Gp15 family bacteriophage protein n=1 Tax=Adlercreutzia muris TaxID=1796610 RepID=UPI00136675FC